jgi:hypothetical protein
MHTRAWRSLVVTLSLAGGCTAGLIGDAAPGSGGSPGGGPVSGTTGAPPSAGKPGLDACTPAALAARPAAPPTRLRRLTTREIQTSTALLFDASFTAALANLDADSPLDGTFSTSDQLVVSESFAQGLNLAVDGLAGKFRATVTRAAYGDACFGADEPAEACAGTFIRAFGRRAFRRALSDDDVAGLLAVYRAGREVGDAGDRFATGLSWVVRAVLQSPQFLYLTELGDPGAASGATTTLLPDEVASALAFSIAGMPPDEALTAAAAAGRLATAEERRAQALRLIAEHPDRWQEQLRQFVPQWLGINFGRPEWAKDTRAVPLFSAAVKAGLQAEVGLYLDDWAAGGARLDVLLTGNGTFVNAATAPVYGVTASGPDFTRVVLDGGQRAGLLTMAGFLGSTSHVAETSPVLRGKAVLQKLLCREPPPPPPMVPPLPPVDRSAPATTRARFAAHLGAPACRSCHATFEPMGDAFEEFDALGAFRTQQNGTPIDSRGALVAADGSQQPVPDAVALARLLARSSETFDCVARQVYRFTLGRPETDYDLCTLAAASQALGQPPFDLRALVAALAASDSFVTRTVDR